MTRSAGSVRVAIIDVHASHRDDAPAAGCRNNIENAAALSEGDVGPLHQPAPHGDLDQPRDSE